jgi:uncharacterized protein (TIGR03437 family)
LGDVDFGQVYVTTADGSISIGYGLGPNLGIFVAFQAPALKASSGVYLSPVGVLNAASNAPFTAFLAPGEFLTLYGSGLATTSGGGLVSAGVPFPKMLNGVQVLINEVPAPIYYVSPNQVSVIVPNVTTQAVAQIQVVNNGANSNIVTQFVGLTSPGVFTTDETGFGIAAALRPDFSVVSDSNPAQLGETLAVYVAGLGAVTPSVQDGTAAPSSPLSSTTDTPSVYVYDFNGNCETDANGNCLPATVTFSGLAPGFAGLYQINFTVPSGLASGDGTLQIVGPDSDTNLSLLPIGTASSAVPRAVHRGTLAARRHKASASQHRYSATRE